MEFLGVVWVAENEWAAPGNGQDPPEGSEMQNLLAALDEQAETGEWSFRLPVDPNSAAGQFAERYNHVMAALQRAVAKTDAIVQTARDGIITFSTDDLSITMFNPAAQQMFGYGEHEALGKPASLLFAAQVGAQSESMNRTELATRLPGWLAGAAHETYARRANGTLFPMEISVLEVVSDEGSFYTGTLRDITERKRVEEELALVRDQALEANRTKSAFLATMSHELRTPLNAIIGYSEMLQEDAEATDHADMIPDLKRINAAGQHLLELINDVLDLSKIEAGRMDLYVEPFSVLSVVRDVVSIMHPLAEKNQNRLDVYCEDFTMGSDVTKLRQTLFNLLSNACKFT